MNQTTERKQICCIRTRSIYITILLLSLVLITCKISLFSHNSWFYQGKGMKKWEGGLFKVHSSGGQISKKSYALLSEFYCAEKSRFSVNNPNSSSISYQDAEKLCTKFEKLKSGMLAYCALSSLGLLFWTIAVVLLAIGKDQTPILRACFVLVCIDILLEFSSMICIVASPDLTFGDDCSYLSNNDTNNTSAVKTCGDQAALLAILLQLTILCFQFWNAANFCVFFSCPRIVIVERPVDRSENRNEVEKNKGDVEYPD